MSDEKMPTALIHELVRKKALENGLSKEAIDSYLSDPDNAKKIETDFRHAYLAGLSYGYKQGYKQGYNTSKQNGRALVATTTPSS